MRDSTVYVVTGNAHNGSERLVTVDKETAIDLYEELVQTHFDAVRACIERNPVMYAERKAR